MGETAVSPYVDALIVANVAPAEVVTRLNYCTHIRLKRGATTHNDTYFHTSAHPVELGNDRRRRGSSPCRQIESPLTPLIPTGQAGSALSTLDMYRINDTTGGDV